MISFSSLAAREVDHGDRAVRLVRDEPLLAVARDRGAVRVAPGLRRSATSLDSVSMIAALWARLSAASSVLPSGLIARSRGQETRSVRVGGKSCGGGASSGAGTSITPSRVALPVLRVVAEDVDHVALEARRVLGRSAVEVRVVVGRRACPRRRRSGRRAPSRCRRSRPASGSSGRRGRSCACAAAPAALAAPTLAALLASSRRARSGCRSRRGRPRASRGSGRSS